MLQKYIELTIPGEKQGKRRLHPPRTLAIHLMEHDVLDEDLFKIYPSLSTLVERLQKDIGKNRILKKECFRGCIFCPAADDSHPVLPTCLERTQKAREISDLAPRQIRISRPDSVRLRIEKLLDNPPTGIPILALIGFLAVKSTILLLDIAEDFVPLILSPVINLFNSLANLFSQGSLGQIVVSAIPEGILLPLK